MSGNVTTRLIVVVLAILLSRHGLAQDFTPELLSPLAMEAPYDGFVVDNSEPMLETFERLHVTFSGKPADGLDFALSGWTRFEWTLPTPTPGQYLVSLVVHSGDKRPGRFGYVVNGAEYVSEEFRLSGYQWGSRMAAFLVRIPEGQAQTRMFVAGNGLYLRRVAFSRVTRPIRFQDGKIKELARSSYRTLLRRRGEQPGKPACVVLVPERGPEAEPARKLAGRLGLAIRQEPELKNPFPAYPLTDRVTPDTNLILLSAGRGGPLTRALRRAGTIGGVPTSRGVDNTWRIRTIARPFRGRANVIVISAGNPSALARACEAFASLSLETGQQRVYEKFLTFGPESTDGGEPAHVRDHRAPDDPWWRKQEDNLGEPLCGIKWRSAPARGFLSCIGTYAGAYWSTGNERYAELFRKYVLKMEEDRVYTSYGDGADAHMALFTLMRAWDRVEEASAFSDKDRLRVVNHLLWCLESDQGFPRSGGCHWYSGKVRMRHNHQTILGQGMMAAYLYYSRSYELGLPQLWKAWCDDLIENGTAWGHAPEDSALYEPGTFREVAEMVHYQGLSTKGIQGTEHWPQTALRFLAAQDSFGFPAAYGDCWSPFQVTAMDFFQVMADDWGWPAMQFVEDHRIRGFRYARPEDRIASESHVSRNGSTDVGGERVPGDSSAVAETLRPLLGLAVLPMGRGYYDYMTGAVGNEKSWQQYERPLAPPYDKTADKIQYRSGWGVQDEYLLVDALGWADHGQLDLGAIVHYCEGGRLWLVDCGYANKGPEHHSMLDLARDGKSAWRKRANAGQLRWTGFLYEGQQMMEITECQPGRPGTPGPFRFALRTRDYAGATWERTVAGGAGNGLLIQDVVTAEQAGEYEAFFTLRFLGTLEGEGDHWSVRQKGAELPVVLQTMKGDLVRPGLWQADDRTRQEGRYAGYAFVEDDGRPKTLVWTRKIELNRGETTVFRATLGPSTRTGPAAKNPISSLKSPPTIRWLEISTSEWKTQQTVNADQNVTLCPPGSGPRFVLLARHGPAGGVLAGEPTFTRTSLKTVAETNMGHVPLVDVNGDGVVDIVAGIQWFEGPTWKRHRLYPPDSKPTAIDIGFTVPYDLDGDGDLDLTAHRRSSDDRNKNELFWFENPGPPSTGIWTKHHITWDIRWPEVLVFVDIDGDGRDEIVCSDVCPGKGIRIYEIPRDPETASSWSWTTVDKSPLHGLGIGDLNEDGRLDIVSDFVWFERGANGDWARHSLPSPGSARRGHETMQIKVYDVDADGDADLILPRAHHYGAYWLESSGGKKPSFKLHEILPGKLPSQLHGVAYADIDGDGDLDIFAGKSRYRHGDPGNDDPLDVFWIELVRSGGRVTWVKHQLGTDLTMGIGPTIADVDADGDLDLVLRGHGIGGRYVIGTRQTNVTLFIQNGSPAAKTEDKGEDKGGRGDKGDRRIY